MKNIDTNLVTMMQDRGYEPLDTADFASGRIFLSGTTGETAFVKVLDKPKKKVLGTEDIQDLLQDLEDCGALRGLIAGHGMSSQAESLIHENNNSSSGTRLEFFDLEKLQINPTRTVLYNPHTLVVGDELEEVRRVYSNNGDTSLQNLPKLIAGECPIVRYFGWEIGDVIKITRIPKQIREYTSRKTPQIVYRIVI